MSKRRGPNRPHPALPLRDVEAFAQHIRDRNGGHPMNRVLLAEAAGTKPSSSRYRYLVVASTRYGVTTGSYNAETVALTAIGEKLTAPRNSDELTAARREAFRSVPIFRDLLNHFANNKVPTGAFLKNTLERAPFEVDAEWSKEVAELFVADGRYVGLLREVGGSLFAVPDASAAVPEVEATHEAEAGAMDSDGAAGGSPDEGPGLQRERLAPMQIFIGHGKNRKPLEQLQKILNEWRVPFLVAIDEPHAGRPISQKVGELMRACSAGIFIFTRDVASAAAEDRKVFRPSGNVVYELGAASLLYGRKIVILKEEGVDFPSDFSDLGWIEFEEDAVDAKAMELLRELIALDAVRLVSTASPG